MNLDVINILVISVAIVNTLYGLVVYSRNRSDATNIAFFFLTMCVSLWGISMFVMRASLGAEISLWGSRALYASAAMIPFMSLVFACVFPKPTVHFTVYEKYVFPIPFLLAFAVSLLPTGGLIDSIRILHGLEPVIVFDTTIHTLYSLYIVSYFSWVYVILFKKLFSSSGLQRVQVAYILVGTMITTWVAVVTNLLMPYFGLYYLNWVGQVGILAMITSITYAILKHHLFNIKIIATEFLVFTLCLILFVRVFGYTSLNEQLLSVGIFIAAVVIGILLVRSVIREVRTREEIESLYKELEIKNAKLTELDTLKSQFLSIATHELRTPITIVRNFVSLMIDGSYGKVPPAALEAARQVFERATDMARSVDSYLNVSRIEQGKMLYTFATVDITRLTKLAVDGMKANADKKSLTLSLTVKPGAESMQANADGPKISEVLVNLLDNSIKYTPKGSVAVTVEKIGKVGRVTIKDTGVGMSQKTMQGLFKLFSPGEDAKKVNVSSTGIGMYVSKTHVEAHKGTLNGYSEGEGKGSQFVLDLPLLS